MGQKTFFCEIKLDHTNPHTHKYQNKKIKNNNKPYNGLCTHKYPAMVGWQMVEMKNIALESIRKWFQWESKKKTQQGNNPEWETQNVKEQGRTWARRIT